jgi:hypothetical protein
MNLKRTISLNRQIALFDSDCLEPVGKGSFPLPAMPNFTVRQRMQPKADIINALHDFAQRHDLTVLFTQCCSARLVTDNNPPETLVVPLDGCGSAWQDRVGKARFINIRKPSGLGDSDTTRSFICRYFDAFQHNANVGHLLKLLNIPVFVLFGHGFDLCVDSSAKGLLAAGFKVHLLTDVTAPSATGYGPYGTTESSRAILDYLIKIGVTTGTSNDFLQEMENHVV